MQVLGSNNAGAGSDTLWPELMSEEKESKCHNYLVQLYIIMDLHF